MASTRQTPGGPWACVPASLCACPGQRTCNGMPRDCPCKGTQPLSRYSGIHLLPVQAMEDAVEVHIILDVVVDWTLDLSHWESEEEGGQGT